ncbi:hypothetical protein D3C72_1870250 [compost metagenome]
MSFNWVKNGLLVSRILGLDLVLGDFKAPSRPMISGVSGGKVMPISVPVVIPNPGAEPFISRMPKRSSMILGSSILTSDSKS